MAATEPAAAAVEAALDRLLSSATFCGAPRLRRFLEVVVRHRLAGDQDQIKEYTVGVEVFERGARFDPRCDAIVRVEALKLREKLAEYYRTEGASEPVTISLPKGGYQPLFHAREGPPAAILDDPDSLCCQTDSLILQSSPAALTRARHMLDCAIGRWPDHADLQVRLTSVTLASIEMELLAPRDGLPILRRAAARAMRLDRRRHDARFYAAVSRIAEAKKTAAVEAVSRSMRAAPRSAAVHYWAASVYAADLRMSDMLMHMDLAVRLQPHALFFQTWRAVALAWAGQTDTAIRHLRHILVVEPSDALASFWLGQICAHTGRHDEARDAAARADALAGTMQALAGRGFVEAMAGQIDAAQAILETLTAAARTQFVPESRIAAIYVALGRLAPAADALRRGQCELDWDLGWARGDQRWIPLRGRLAGF